MENQVVKALQNHLTLLKTVMNNCTKACADMLEVLGQPLIDDTHVRYLRD